MMLRFVLEPKSLLVNEQEQKLKDSESAISSLQVSLAAFSLSLIAISSFTVLWHYRFTPFGRVSVREYDTAFVEIKRSWNRPFSSPILFLSKKGSLSIFSYIG